MAARQRARSQHFLLLESKSDGDDAPIVLRPAKSGGESNCVKTDTRRRSKST